LTPPPSQTTLAYSPIRQVIELSIVIPAYNEASSIAEVIRRLSEMASGVVKSYEIVVVDDGSVDGTYDVVRSIARVNSSVVALRSSVNQGKGSAVKLASQVVRGNAVVVLDGDMDIDVSSLKEYVEILRVYDICVASKRHPDSSYEAPLTRKFLSTAFNKLIRLTTGIALSDTQTGLKGMRGEHFRRIMQVISVKRFAYDVEILAVAQLMGLRIAESPVRIVQTSQFSKKAIMYMCVDVLGIVYRLHVIHWYQKNLSNPDLMYKPLIPI
jgi:dolichyl-phosphate beta-glucosyltransferase